MIKIIERNTTNLQKNENKSDNLKNDTNRKYKNEAEEIIKRLLTEI